MRIRKAVITAAGPSQRTLPLNTLIDSDGAEKPVLRIIIGHARAAGIDDVAVVIHPGDEAAYREAAGGDARGLTLIPQPEPRGYGHAVYCAREFVGSAPFLHLVGDHVYVGGDATACAQALVNLADREDCSVSAVQPTRETLLRHYGVVAGPRSGAQPGVYRVEAIVEKPTPTEAEQRLIVAGLRAGYYLCFYGMHALTHTIFEVLEEQLRNGAGRLPLSPAQAEVARREQYLALVVPGRRYDLGVPYGFLTAQLALALHGRDSSEVLSKVLDVVAAREFEAAGTGAHE